MRKNKIQYYGAYEGEQEEKYFKHLQKLINNDDRSLFDVNFNFDSPKGGSPLEVCKYADKSITFGNRRDAEKKHRIVAVFDYDFKDDIFKNAIKYCNDKKIVAGYSNVNFDLWLILHKKYYSACVSNNSGYHSTIRTLYKLPKFADIKNQEIIEEMVSQITLDDVIEAIANCKKIEEDKKLTGTLYSGLLGHYEQPYIKLHEFVEKVLKDVGIIKD